MTTFQHDSWQHDMRPTACTRWSEPRGKFCNNGDTCIQTYLMAMLGLWRLWGWEAGGHCMCCVVMVCAALCEGWRAELVQLSIAATWHRPWPDHSAAHRCPGHTAPTTSQRNLMQCSTALYSVLLCTRHCHDYQWSFQFMMTIHLIYTGVFAIKYQVVSLVAIGGENRAELHFN